MEIWLAIVEISNNDLLQDYETIVKITCALPDAERKTKIKEYMECFDSAEFNKIVYDCYLSTGTVIKNLSSSVLAKSKKIVKTQTYIM